MKVLFIGRFQPFHRGHLEVVKDLSKKFDKVIIGIGSSQYSHTKKNPFTVEERIKMIVESLEREGIKNFKIYPVTDIHNYPKWVEHVESVIPEKFDVVVARNPITLKLFKEKGYVVKRPPLYGGKECKGSIIRDKIAKGDDWEHFVPLPVADLIKKIGGVERIRKLYMD